MAAQDLASSSSSAAPTNVPCSFDVFLSFRGEDIRNNFISFLHKALKDKGINVFVDSDKRWVGKAIGSTLSEAIEGSKISIPVLSKGYADSKWCLQELALIVQCHRSNSQFILPIFYDVDPSHVRRQLGSFEEAFCKHEKKFNLDIIKEWKDALETVGNLIGEVMDENRNEAELVELLVKRVWGELFSDTHLAVCEYPVGIDCSINDLISLLHIGSNDVQFVGICGFGGIGKTTIAKAAYNRIFSTFKRHSFLSDVREQANQWLGRVSLQKQLLKDIFNMDIDIANVDRGKFLIEQRLRKEKVLVVLDDVDSKEQVDALVGKHTWFGEGSRIIITTRNEQILSVARVNNVYKPQVLDLEKSLQLFSWHAFENVQPPEDYMQFSRDVAKYSGGLPLTLKVLGSYLLDISDKEEWKSTLQKLKIIPNDEIQTRLKISYDNLKDDFQKTVFLDAACFFIGWDRETIISIWEACGYFPKSALPNLTRRSLLYFEKSGFHKYTLRMHDQIRDMGREIIRAENHMEPGKRSRLWYYGDILDVLKEHKGTDMTTSISLPDRLPLNLTSEHFRMIPKLRFLNIYMGNIVGDFSHLPSALRCFTWTRCSWKTIPTNFSHDRLVYLDLSKSNIKQAWNVRPQDKNKCFKELKVLILNFCYGLIESPKFSWFPYLERLDLGRCKSLKLLDESIGQLSQLKYLTLTLCKSLEELPDGVGLLEKLEVLEANCCHRIKKLPRSMWGMRRLHSIYLAEASILKFPEGFSSLENLKELNISECHKLKELPELPSSLVELCCRSCHSLVRLPNLSRLKNLRKLMLDYCFELEKILGLEGTEFLEELNAVACNKLTRTRRMKLGQGTVLPDRSQLRGYSFTAAADGIHTNSTGLILCVVLSFDNPCIPNGCKGDLHLEISASVRRKDKTSRYLHELKIKGVEYTTVRDTIYIHYFEGFDWFGIPLQGEDAIEILDAISWSFYSDSVLTTHTKDYTIKFWKLLYENKEPHQQMPDQYSDASPSGLLDFFHLSCVYEATPSGSSDEEEAEVDSSGSWEKQRKAERWEVEEWEWEEEESEDDASGNSEVEESEDDASGNSEVEESKDDASGNSEEEEPEDENVDDALSTSHHTEEEDPEMNNTTIDLLSCLLGFDSVSDGVEKEGEMLRPSKRTRLHDNNDEAPGPSLSLSLSTSSEMKSNNGFNLQQMLSQPPNIDDDDEAAGLSLSLALIPYKNF